MFTKRVFRLLIGRHDYIMQIKWIARSEQPIRDHDFNTCMNLLSDYKVINLSCSLCFSGVACAIASVQPILRRWSGARTASATTGVRAAPTTCCALATAPVSVAACVNACPTGRFVPFGCRSPWLMDYTDSIVIRISVSQFPLFFSTHFIWLDKYSVHEILVRVLRVNLTGNWYLVQLCKIGDYTIELMMALLRFGERAKAANFPPTTARVTQAETKRRAQATATARTASASVIKSTSAVIAENTAKTVR